jgi:hypothetical protein
MCMDVFPLYSESYVNPRTSNIMADVGSAKCLEILLWLKGFSR